MSLRKIFVFIFVLLFLLLASHFTLVKPVLASQLTVEVKTDKDEYQAGEIVTIEVRVYLNGQLVPAHIDMAYIDISYDSGYTRRNYITRDFKQVSPGVFVARGKAIKAGSRQIYVAARAIIKEDCCYKTVCGFGSAHFLVYQPCPPVYYPCPPVYQPCPPVYQPCPCFYQKWVVTYYVPHVDPTLELPRSVRDYLDQLGVEVTFQEAPKGSEAWGWGLLAKPNDALADVGLTLDPQTGTISGDLQLRYHRRRFLFLIYAMDTQGQCVAKIWIDLHLRHGDP
jgi:hypothetical protein